MCTLLGDQEKQSDSGKAVSETVTLFSLHNTDAGAQTWATRGAVGTTRSTEHGSAWSLGSGDREPGPYRRAFL